MVVEDPEYTAKYPEEYRIELNVHLKDGSTRRFLSTCPSGDPRAPQYVSDPTRLHRETEKKCTALLEECGFGDRAEPLRRAVYGLSAAPDMQSIALVLRAEAAGVRQPSAMRKTGRGKRI